MNNGPKGGKGKNMTRTILKRLASCIQVILIVIITGVVLNAQENINKQGKNCLWEVTSGSNKVYLLGSIHFLRQENYPLKEPMETVLNDVQTVVFEIDLAEAETPSAQQMILTKATFSDGNNLKKSLKEETYNLAKQKMKKLGLDIGQLNNYEPWFLSITMITMKLAQLGFDPNYGIDKYFFNKAKKAGKSIVGLETIDYHISLFDELSKEDQEKLVLQTLRDFDAFDKEMNKLVTAWSSGDFKRLENLLLKSFREFPQVYDKLIIQRNENWLPKIDVFLGEKANYLVIVGAGHLLGNKGLVEQLKRKGYSVRQL
jgi:uncharacterized protein YbaP (TraB family)